MLCSPMSTSKMWLVPWSMNRTCLSKLYPNDIATFSQSMHVTHCTSHTRHTSHITHHTSHIIHHTSHIIHHTHILTHHTHHTSHISGVWYCIVVCWCMCLSCTYTHAHTHTHTHTHTYTHTHIYIYIERSSNKSCQSTISKLWKEFDKTIGYGIFVMSFCSAS